MPTVAAGRSRSTRHSLKRPMEREDRHARRQGPSRRAGECSSSHKPRPRSKRAPYRVTSALRRRSRAGPLLYYAMILQAGFAAPGLPSFLSTAPPWACMPARRKDGPARLQASMPTGLPSVLTIFPSVERTARLQARQIGSAQRLVGAGPICGACGSFEPKRAEQQVTRRAGLLERGLPRLPEPSPGRRRPARMGFESGVRR
jgi:hypothetical protein